jgi:hypothetical protein
VTSFPIHFQHRTLAILGVKVEELYTRMFNHFPRNHRAVAVLLGSPLGMGDSFEGANFFDVLLLLSNWFPKCIISDDLPRAKNVFSYPCLLHGCHLGSCS